MLIALWEKSSKLNIIKKCNLYVNNKFLCYFVVFLAVYNFDTSVLDQEVLQQIYELVSVSKLRSIILSYRKTILPTRIMVAFIMHPLLFNILQNFSHLMVSNFTILLFYQTTHQQHPKPCAGSRFFKLGKQENQRLINVSFIYTP